MWGLCCTQERTLTLRRSTTDKPAVLARPDLEPFQDISPADQIQKRTSRYRILQEAVLRRYVCHPCPLLKENPLSWSWVAPLSHCSHAQRPHPQSEATTHSVEAGHVLSRHDNPRLHLLIPFSPQNTFMVGESIIINICFFNALFPWSHSPWNPGQALRIAVLTPPSSTNCNVMAHVRTNNAGCQQSELTKTDLNNLFNGLSTCGKSFFYFLYPTLSFMEPGFLDESSLQLVFTARSSPPGDFTIWVLLTILVCSGAVFTSSEGMDSSRIL